MLVQYLPPFFLSMDNAALGGHFPNLVLFWPRSTLCLHIPPMYESFKKQEMEGVEERREERKKRKRRVKPPGIIARGL